MTWQTVQQCDQCWHAEQTDGRLPVRVLEPHRERTRCVDCGRMTRSGIYVRREITS